MNTKLLSVTLLAAATAFATCSARAQNISESTEPLGPAAIVTNPNLLPPPGAGFGWVDHPCADEAKYVADWTVGSQHFAGVAAQAHAIILSNFGTPTMVIDGSDVVTTFSATLTASSTIALGQPLATQMSLPGSMSVRMYGKALATTGTFLMKIESMSFTLAEIPINIRQDPDNASWGSLTITDLGDGTFSMTSGLDAYTQLSMKNTSANPPTFLPYAPDVNAPEHFEIRNASCQSASAPIADFNWLPSAPLSGQAVTFTQTTTGGYASCKWDFGDGTTSTEQNPTHYYTASGVFAIRLTVQTSGGTDSIGRLMSVGSGTRTRGLAKGVLSAAPARVRGR